MQTPRPEPRRVGRYELERVLGQGGMGVVHEARDLELGRVVALKELLLAGGDDEQALARFEREGQALARLSHPNIVRIHEVGRGPRGPFLVMERIEGGSLQAQLDRSGPLACDDAARLGLSLAGALAHAHAQGVLHRDLKPENVLLDGESRPVLTDFGLARELAESRERLTRSGAILGTPAFMAPEQADGAEVDERTDVYGLGAVLYASLTGRAPFVGQGFALLRLVLSALPERPSALRADVPEDLERIVLQCLAKEPDERYPSMQALAEDLERHLAGAAVGAQRPSRRRRRPALAAAVVAGAALVLAIGLAAVRAPGGAASEPAPGRSALSERMAAARTALAANPSDRDARDGLAAVASEARSSVAGLEPQARRGLEGLLAEVASELARADGVAAREALVRARGLGTPLERFAALERWIAEHAADREGLSASFGEAREALAKCAAARLCVLPAGDRVARFGAHHLEVIAFAETQPQGTALVDAAIWLMELATGEERALARARYRRTASFRAFDARGGRAVAAAGPILLLVDPARGPSRTFRFGEQPIIQVALEADGPRVALSTARELVMLDGDGAVIGRRSTAPFGANGLAFTASGELIVTYFSQERPNYVARHALPGLQVLGRKGLLSSPRALAVTGALVAVGCDDGSTLLLELPSLRERARLPEDGRDSPYTAPIASPDRRPTVRSLVFAPDGQRLYAARGSLADGVDAFELWCWEVSTGAPVAPWDPARHPERWRGGTVLDVAPEGRQALLAGPGGFALWATPPPPPD